MKGCDSYSSGTKESWRGWVWNRIVERLPGYHPKMGPTARRHMCSDKTVVYLAGTDDNDRACGLARGFLNENLIAVDVDESRVLSSRRSGGVAICGTLQKVIMEWPRDWKIDVVIADFCGGLNQGESQFRSCLTFAPLGCGVVCVNLMRGRESLSAKDYHAIVHASSKHRGRLWTELAMISAYEQLVRQGAVNASKDIERSYGTANPAYTSYRSPESGQIFDSVVLRWPFKASDLTEKKLLESWLPKKCTNSGNIRGKLAALRAVRTMKAKVVV